MAKDNPQNHNPTALKYNIGQGGETKNPARGGESTIKDGNIKDILLLSLPNLIISIITWLLFVIFKPTFWLSISIVSIMVVVRLVIEKEIRWYIYIVQLAIMYLFLIVLYIINFIFVGHAIIGTFVVVIIIAVYIIYRNWKAYILAIEKVEYMIYKKPVHELKKKDKEESDGKEI